MISKKWFFSYLDLLLKDIPKEVYLGLLLIFCIVAVVLFTWRGIKAWRWLVGLLLLEYVVVLLYVTVIFRDAEKVAGYNFKPFWTYGEIAKGIRDDLLPQVIMNVAVFVPIGIMTGFVTQNRVLRNRWMIVIGLGIGLSVGIEIIQFLFSKGFAELDDIMHNTLGCIIGFVVYRGVEGLIKSKS